MKIIYLLSLLVIFLSPVSLIAKNNERTLIFNLPIKNAHFIGRKEELKEIKNLLNTQNIISLSGSPGIGKSQIARQYTYSSIDSYQIIFWIDGDSDISTQYKELAEEMNKKILKKNKISISGETNIAIMNETKDKLRTLDNKWLIIYDNYQIDNIAKEMPHTNNNGKVIITTRKNSIWDIGMKIKKFKREESIAAIKRILSKIKEKEANMLSELMGDYPLAIIHSAKYIKYCDISVEKYIDLYKKEQKEIVRHHNQLIGKVILDDYRKTVFTVLRLNIESIINDSKKEDMLDLLYLLSNIYNKHIPRDLIIEYFNNKEIKVDALVLVLLDYSFLNSENQYANSNLNTYTIHELQQSAIINYLDEYRYKGNPAKIMRAFNNLLTGKLEYFIRLLWSRPYMLKHIESITEKYKDIEDNQLIRADIRLLEYYLSGKRDRKKAEELINKINTHIDKPWVSKLLIARLNMMLASLDIWFTSNYSRAWDLVDKAHNIIMKEQDVEEEKLMVYNRMVQIKMLQGQADEAIKLSDKARSLLELNNLGNKEAYYGLRAALYMDIGNYEEAYESNNLAIVEDKKAHDEKQNIMGIKAVYIYKALILIKREQYQEALELLKKINAEINKGDNKEMHLARVESLIAKCYLGLGEVKLARVYIDRSLMNYGNKNIKELKNRDYPYALLIAGQIANKEGKKEIAKNKYMEAEAIYRNFLESMKIDDISELLTSMAINYYQLKDQKSFDANIKAHDDIFGLGDLRKARIIKTLSK